MCLSKPNRAAAGRGGRQASHRAQFRASCLDGQDTARKEDRHGSRLLQPCISIPLFYVQHVFVGSHAKIVVYVTLIGWLSMRYASAQKTSQQPYCSSSSTNSSDAPQSCSLYIRALWRMDRSPGRMEVLQVKWNKPRAITTFSKANEKLGSASGA